MINKQMFEVEEKYKEMPVEQRLEEKKSGRIKHCQTRRGGGGKA